MGDGILGLVEDAIGTVEQIARMANRQSSPAARRASAPVPLRPAGPARNQRATTTRVASTFSIIDAIDAETGRPVYIVKNQQGDSASCSSMAFAQRVRDSLG